MDWDGGDHGHGRGASVGAPWVSRNDDMGVESAVLEGEAVVVGEGEGGLSSGAPRATPMTQEE